MRRFRGLKQLVHDAVALTTELVEDMNESVSAKVVSVLERVEPLAAPTHAVDGVRRVSSRVVYESIHGVNLLVSKLGDAGLDAIDKGGPPPPIVRMRSDCIKEAPWLEDAALGALNGVVGDFLHDRGNSLALAMQLRVGDTYLQPEDIDAERVAVFVHGLSTTEWSWAMAAEAYHGDPATHFGTLLQRDRGYTPVFVRYNSGRHISQNGRELADLLDRLRCKELVLIGHSMGGLVARSACYYGAEQPWVSRLTHVACLGTPHLGAPLEKAGNVVTSVLSFFDIPATQVPARIAKGRSAGIKDLRFGYVIDEDWQGHDPDALLDNQRRDLPWLPGVTYAFIATTLGGTPDHPVGQVLGDMLVRKVSASGPVEASRPIVLHTDHIPGVPHHEIQNHPDVYRSLLTIFPEPA